MMSSIDDLIPRFKELRLSGVLQSLELRTRQAVDDDLAHGEFLYRLHAAATAAQRRSERVVIGPDWPPRECDRAELDHSPVPVSVGEP
jgi:hypothetical protein